MSGECITFAADLENKVTTNIKKERRFVMTREELKEKAMGEFMTREEYEKRVDKILDEKPFDYEKMEDNYLPAYAIASGIYKQHTGWMENGASYDSTNRWVKRMAKQVRQCLLAYVLTGY